MQYTFADDISEPSKEYDITNWSFSNDLRDVFPDLASNHEIGDELVRRGVIGKSNELDCESACTYVYFKTPGAACAFLKRLNALTEVKNYTPPTLEERTFHQISVADWNKLKGFLKTTLNKKQYADLKKLDIKIFG